ncbi:lipopolysaccharide biosynthesis protein [Naasia sp. SYSU D00948]|uniref:lipopolysaccharide biosynthesis protein n=1 Tax=Naasia sp. SYSU D00948 TaxID=2817379 RepID=UPI001B30E037|nr:lipopolysaccharide biosynthesis protein [Naasia sp. SYSU D00948]
MTARVAERGLASSATRGAAVTFAGQGLRIAIQLAGIVILARLLDPADYGVLAMVLAILGVAEVVRDFGLSSAAIQAPVLLPGQKTNLFWINVAVGLGLTLVVLGLSWPIAALYDDARLQPVAAALAFTFLLSGSATQFRADLNRNLRFTALTVSDASGQVAGLTLAILTASLGWGYWALVVQQLVAAAVQLTVAAAATRWLPGRPIRGVPMKPFLAFGSNLAGVQLLGYVSRNVDSVVIGATLGATALGLYNRAFQLMLLPLNQINAPSTRVALPVLSRLQDDRERFEDFLRVGQTILLNVVGPVLALCAAQAPAIVDLALGPQWSGAVPIFQILSIAGFFSTAGYAANWVFLAKGLTGAHLRLALITRPLMVGIILAGAAWGVLGVAVAYSLANVLLWPVQLLWLRRVSDAPVRMMFAGGLRTLLIHGAATAGSFASTLALPAGAPLLRILVGGLALLGVLTLAAAVVPPFRRDVVSILSVRRHLRRRSAVPASKETA